MNRRTFAAISLAAPALARPAKSPAILNEIESRLARRDFRGISKEDLPTPCMVLDLDLFEANVRHMAEHCKRTGIGVRSHVKIHKSPEVTRRQVAAGAIGASCATIAECEMIVNHGVPGVLFTCQPSGRNKISRVAALAKRDPTFITVLDDPMIADQLEEAAAAQKTKVNVIVDVYAGLIRQGCEPGQKALSIAKKVDSSKHLKFRGLMAYSGFGSHTHGFDERRKRSFDDLAGMLETADLCKKDGLNVEIRTGGSTGTYNIDVGKLTELQAGSYVFMDTIYWRIGGKDNPKRYEDFKPCLTVLTTVVSRTRDGVCSIDAGNKAMLKPTDEVKGHAAVKIENQGAEYGLLRWDSGTGFKPGDKVEVYPSNLDTSTNVYERYYIAKGDKIVDVWPIMDRAGAAQR
jgi:D-serine deaminase-like pyridoxal phosphate-dependent protein